MRREREERAAGRSETAALAAAAATSGRAVLVSGITVLIAMAGMFLSGDKTFMSFSVGTMLVVAVAMIGSLTVLPAVLSQARRPRREGPGPVRAPPPPLSRATAASGARILDRVLRRPARFGRRRTAVLVALAVPTLSLHTRRRASTASRSSAVEPFERIIDAFPGTPDPAVVAIKADNVNSAPSRAAIAELKRQALATGEMHPPINVDINRDGTVARSRSRSPATASTPPPTEALADSAPASSCRRRSARLDGVEYAVTGQTANSQDFNKAQTSSMPKVFGFVLLFAFGLLLVSFRSIVIALKAILLNLLSVAAAYGVLVAIFQWGWGEGLLDFQSNGGIANWLPMFMFVILFGLSMDYHVFILSRIREAYDRGLSTDKAIAHGIKSTAGTVTSAAVVMVGVFAVFTHPPARRPQGDGHRPRGRRPDRRDARPRGAPAGVDEAARRRQLVPAELARVAARASSTAARPSAIEPPPALEPAA